VRGEGISAGGEHARHHRLFPGRGHGGHGDDSVEGPEQESRVDPIRDLTLSHPQVVASSGPDHAVRAASQFADSSINFEHQTQRDKSATPV
jgi:hypothetical protein